jgi:hypothetical protein
MKLAGKGLVGARQKKSEEWRGKQFLPCKFDFFRLAPAVKHSFSDLFGTDATGDPPLRSNLNDAFFNINVNIVDVQVGDVLK